MGPGERNFLIALGLIIIGAVALVIWEFRKGSAASVSAAPSDAANTNPNLIDAGSGGPAYLSYNTPGFYNVGPPVDNYMTAAPSPSTSNAPSAYCGTCAAFSKVLQ